MIAFIRHGDETSGAAAIDYILEAGVEVGFDETFADAVDLGCVVGADDGEHVGPEADEGPMVFVEGELSFVGGAVVDG